MSVGSPTRYQIRALDPHAHLFEVGCTIEDPAHGGRRYRLPTWVPGSYLIREFVRHFVEVRAHDASGPIPVATRTLARWRA